MGIYNHLDRWLYKRLAEWHISTKPSQVRWGITQIVIGVSLFLVASSIAFIALWLSFWSSEMVVVGWCALGFAIVCFGTGIFAICYMVHLGKEFLKDQEPSSEYKAIKELAVITKAVANKLGVTDKELADAKTQIENNKEEKQLKGEVE